MPTNDYKPFAYGGSANVESPATWAADAVRTNGFLTGVAPSIKLNTAWRQASVGVAALAQFIVDQTAASLADDGSVATFETALIAALNAYVAGVLAAGTLPIRNKKNTAAISAGVVNINCNLGNYFLVAMTASITSLTFSNIPAAGLEQEITIDFLADGTDHGHTFLSEALLAWLGPGGAAGTAPTFGYTAGYKNTVVIKCGDGVTTTVSAAYSGTSAG
jgi:hypothetical protein